VEAQTEKYAVFSKAFAELSEESQGKLMEMACRLLETHQFAKQGTGGEVEEGNLEDSMLFNACFHALN